MVLFPDGRRKFLMQNEILLSLFKKVISGRKFNAFNSIYLNCDTLVSDRQYNSERHLKDQAMFAFAFKFSYFSKCAFIPNAMAKLKL